MSYSRLGCSACFINGKIYVIGSSYNEGADVMEVLDLEKIISKKIEMNNDRSFSAIVGLDDLLYLFGG